GMGVSEVTGRRSRGGEEAAQVRKGRSRLLDMGVMARLRDGDQPCARHALGTGAAISRADDAVVLAPDEQRRNLDPLQPMPEFGVVHVGLPTQARKTLVVTCNDR